MLPSPMAWGLALALACSSLVSTAALSCGAARPTPLDTAEAACELELQTTVNGGECDSYEHLDGCPAYILAQRQCWVLLVEAQRRERER